MKMTKLEATLNSRNFFVSLVSILFLFFQTQGIDIPNAEGLASEIVDSLSGGNLFAALSVLIPNMLNPIMKLFKSKFNLAFLKSLNFWTQFSTTLLMGVATFGILWPEGAAMNFIEAIFGGQWNLILTALMVNIVNPIMHFIENKPGKKLPEVRIATS